MLNTFYDKFIFVNALKYKHNNFFLINIPFAIVPAELLAGLVSDDAKQNKAIYYAVKESAKAGMLKQFDIDFGYESEKSLVLLRDFFTASGWGGINFSDIDRQNSRAIVTVSDSPVGNMLHGKSKAEVDHFLRGVFAGIFSSHFRKDVDCAELKCIALGERECEFVIKELKDFDFSKKEIRRQLEV